MALPLPASLTPTKAAAFRDCPFAFRRTYIERIPTPPTQQLVVGVLTHAVLERFYRLPRGERQRAELDHVVATVMASASQHRDVAAYVTGLEPDAFEGLGRTVRNLAARLLELEDPATVNAIGVELRLEMPLGRARLRGVIDRLDVDDNGERIITDYKTGKAPPPALERARLAGVFTYALLIARELGTLPRLVRLVYLSDGCVIEQAPTPRLLRGVEAQLEAVWSAIERACASDDFRPRPSPLCHACAHRAACPALGAVA